MSRIVRKVEGGTGGSCLPDSDSAPEEGDASVRGSVSGREEAPAEAPEWPTRKQGTRYRGLR